jgi:hypothetical protein
MFAPFPDSIPLGAPRRSTTPDPTAPGTSAQGTAAATRRRASAAPTKDRKRKRSSAIQSASNVPNNPISYDQGFHSGAETGSDTEVNRVDYIVAHHHNTAFKDSGAHTQLCYTIKWVGHPLPSRDLYDHAAICRLHPSYWKAYARWGNGSTSFAGSFTRDSQTARLKRYNSYFLQCWKEHTWAYANRDVTRPRHQELKPGGTIRPPGPKPIDAERFPTESEQDAYTDPGSSSPDPPPIDPAHAPASPKPAASHPSGPPNTAAAPAPDNSATTHRTIPFGDNTDGLLIRTGARSQSSSGSRPPPQTTLQPAMQARLGDPPHSTSKGDRRSRSRSPKRDKRPSQRRGSRSPSPQPGPTTREQPPAHRSGRAATPPPAARRTEPASDTRTTTPDQRKGAARPQESSRK